MHSYWFHNYVNNCFEFPLWPKFSTFKRPEKHEHKHKHGPDDNVLQLNPINTGLLHSEKRNETNEIYGG